MKGKRIFVIIIGLVATIGFCFTPALAVDMDAEITKQLDQSEDDFMLEEPGPDLEISDGSFGEGAQYTWIPIFSFVPASSNTSYSWGGNYRYFTGNTDKFMVASINLPSGAYLASARFYYYDNDGGNVRCIIYRNWFPTTNQVIRNASSSGVPGYGSLFLGLGETIRNGEWNYNVYISASNPTINLRVGGVRLLWYRQISPAPASASFWDVPTSHPFFREIEALASSGITTGFADGSYRPSNPVTRQAMAAFLSRALGLHWDYPY